MTEDFLSRWSRRKQAATQEPARSPPDPESAAAPEQAAGARESESRDPSGTSEGAPQNSGAPAFDPASLPPIESITAETDIRAFIAAGVPTELARAALRRAWTSDPKIRDFVGLADYAWDFNAPGSMAGFGPLAGADALRAQMARRLAPDTTRDGAAEMSSERGSGAKPEAFASTAPASAAPAQDPLGQPTEIMSENQPSQKITALPLREDATRPDREHIAVQHRQDKPEDVQSNAHRKHGRALPES
jgi:hypothetical protein